MIYCCLCTKNLEDVAYICLTSFRFYNKNCILKIFCLNFESEKLKKFGDVQRLDFCKSETSNYGKEPIFLSKIKIIEEQCKLDNVLFFDIDTIFFDNIENLKTDKVYGCYDKVIEGNLFSAQKYINAGFMIFPKCNIELYKEFKKVKDLLRPSLIEQDFFNLFFQDKIEYLDCSFNFGQFNYIKECKKVKMFHFVGNDKLFSESFYCLDDTFKDFYQEFIKYFYITYKDLSFKTRNTVTNNIIKFNLNYLEMIKHSST